MKQLKLTKKKLLGDILNGLLAVNTNKINKALCEQVSFYLIEQGYPEEYTTFNISLILKYYWVNWPGFSCSTLFPVPSVRIRESAALTYSLHSAIGYYEGKYGAKRLELRDYLVKRIRIELKSKQSLKWLTLPIGRL